MPFVDRLRAAGIDPMRPGRAEYLLMNLGLHCNLSCRHCHLAAGPHRREHMDREVMEACLRFCEESGITELDLTGGAPELNPSFRWLVEEARARRLAVTDRCNLAVLSEPGQQDLGEFLAENQVRVMASLPDLSPKATDGMRGGRAFERSLEGLRRLNALGYGRGDLVLTLVQNPPGPELPEPSARVEARFRACLRGEYGIEFTHLETLPNLPIGGFLDDLMARGELAEYMALLEGAFKPPDLVARLCCRSTLTVAWDGTLFDCDFNQAVGWPLLRGGVRRIGEDDLDALTDRRVRCGDHCYGCMAGEPV
jgi:radical SAM/Cys-rich protein